MRWALADAGDGMDDANFETTTANAAILRLSKELAWFEEVLGPAGGERGGRGRGGVHTSDSGGAGLKELGTHMTTGCSKPAAQRHGDDMVTACQRACAGYWLVPPHHLYPFRHSAPLLTSLSQHPPLTPPHP
jgi:hypothetical protein